MIVVTLFGHADIPDVKDRPIRRRGDTRVDRRPFAPKPDRP